MRVYLILLLGLISSCEKSNSDWIDRTNHKDLYKLNYSKSFETYCTEKEPKSLNNTVNYLEQAKRYFDKTFNEDLNFAVIFVDNKNWDKYAFAPPPGMPQSLNNGNIILGFGQSIMARRWQGELNQIPQDKLDSLKIDFGEEINLDLFFRDALSLHELGHLYQFYRTSHKSQRRWLDEVFGNLCQVAAAKNLNTNDVLTRMDHFQYLLIEEDLWGEIVFKSIEEFENDYLKIIKQGKNYGWYQTQFYVIARKLYDKFGDEFLNSFRNFLIEIDPEKVGIINNNQLTQKMIESFGSEAVRLMNWKHEG